VWWDRQRKVIFQTKSRDFDLFRRSLVLKRKRTIDPFFFSPLQTHGSHKKECTWKPPRHRFYIRGPNGGDFWSGPPPHGSDWRFSTLLAILASCSEVTRPWGHKQARHECANNASHICIGNTCMFFWQNLQRRVQNFKSFIIFNYLNCNPSILISN